MTPDALISIWFAILFACLILYVALDGFDLGVGILMLCESDLQRRKAMLNSLSPLWDANETWLILAGGVLFGAFPTAYAAIGQALYGPLMALLFTLMLRGVGFEFVHFAANGKHWLSVFAWASLTAAVVQGILLAAILNGLSFEGQFPLLSLLTVPALVVGYALFGASYLLIKSSGVLHGKTKQRANYCASALAPFAVLSTLWLPNRGFDWFNAGANLALFGMLLYSLRQCREQSPYFFALSLLLFNAISLAYQDFPELLPGIMTLQQAASSPATLGFMLAVIGPLLPLILIYNIYQYRVFRGKSDDIAH